MAGKREKDSMIPLVWIGTFDLRSFLLSAHSRWIRLAINFGTSKEEGVGLGAVAHDDFCKGAPFDDQVEVLPFWAF